MDIDFSEIKFVEVTVLPCNGEHFYQLVKDAEPQPFVYSESHLLSCFHALAASQFSCLSEKSK